MPVAPSLSSLPLDAASIPTLRAAFASGTLTSEHLVALHLARYATADRAAAVLTPNALFVLGLVTAALASGLVSGHFQPERPSWLRVVLALVGGVLLGFGSLISLGCSIGTLLSGIHAFSVSGWLFAAALVAGVYGGLKVRRALGQ